MEIKYEDLRDNAVSYFEDAIEDYKNKKYKNAVSEFWAGILLLLKCKLFMISPVLIAEDIIDCLEISAKYVIKVNKFESSKKTGFNKDEINRIKANYHKVFNSEAELLNAVNIQDINKQNSLKKNFIFIFRQSFGFVNPKTEMNLKTVTLDEILHRFDKLKEPNDVYKKYEKELKLLQKTRNTMEHCISCSTEEQLLALFETTVPFINDFFEEELNESAEQLFNNWDSFLEIEELAKAREKNVDDFINAHIDIEDAKLGISRTSICTKCGHDTIDIGNGVLYCKFCGNEDEYEVCSECGEIIPLDGFISFHDDIGICGECLDNKINDRD
jgi:hypothetical protein